MLNTYETLCKFPMYIKSIEEMISPKGNFECENNDEMKKLVKDHKVAIVGSQNDGSTNEEPKEIKPKKKGRKKKSLESEANSEEEDDKTNDARGAY